ncbi:MAG TPA: redox-regulated ATPase YchF [Acidimicrobiales bacterium]|nr:redox-regulated ATPase YchF [Acidimicrobiales bacterium]
MERIGLVGLPNSGKSSLFNALTGARVPVAPHPFTTTETVIGVAHVADHRLAALAAMSASRKVVEATVEVVDIAGLVAGAEHGEGLGNRFLAGIREVDALCFVLRSFADDKIPGENDPLAALGVLELELVLADLASLEGQLTKQQKAARANPALVKATHAMEAAQAVLSTGVPLYRSTLSSEDKASLGPLFLLTNKPFFCVVNLAEDEVDRAEDVLGPVVAELGDTATVLGVSVELEAEARALEPDERGELLAGLGLGEGALPRVARALFDAIGRWTFLTTGEKESRAWTFRKGAKAPECAGVIHSDLQRGFIRAEVIRWDELVEIGSWAAAKAAGRIRLEGKDYAVRDGDTLEVRFNV